MKKHLHRLWTIVKEAQSIIAILAWLGIFSLFHWDSLLRPVTVRYWQCALIIALPYFVYYLFWIRFKIKQRRFRTGDCVSPLNEPDAQYVVYYYKFWRPTKAVCKRKGVNQTLVVDDKYLMPCSDRPTVQNLIRSIVNPPKSARITKL